LFVREDPNAWIRQLDGYGKPSALWNGLECELSDVWVRFTACRVRTLL
jgi:hypothetical protein